MSASIQPHSPPSAIKTVERISGSEAIVKSLLAEGVDLSVWGIPAAPSCRFTMHCTGSEIRSDTYLCGTNKGPPTRPRVTLARQDGWAFAWQPPVPELPSLVTGIADAMIDSTPIVCITGQVPRELLGSDAFQETDIIGISMPVTKWSYQVTEAEEIPEVFAKAFFCGTISGRPGPVLIDITKNAQFGELDCTYRPCTQVSSYIPRPRLDEAQLAEGRPIDQ